MNLILKRMSLETAFNINIILGKTLFQEKKMIFFLFLQENIRCGYSLEAPRRGASNEYPQHMFS